jgi:uncharacterized radical SAM superfamily Fe-S cluster-containing enzyme
MMEREILEQALDAVVPKFQRACDQVRRLNSHIQSLQVRYDRAKRDNQRSFRYSLRLKIATVEGVRNTYYEYACEIGAQVEDLQVELATLYPDAIQMY